MEPRQIAIQAAAVLLSPLVAIVVGRRLDDRKARRTRKENLFTILVGSRHDPNQQFMSAVNLIPVLYDKGSRVRQLHKEFYDAVQREKTAAQPMERPNELLTQLILAVCRDLGYQQDIEESDIRNVFQLKPTGVQWTHGDLDEVPKP